MGNVAKQIIAGFTVVLLTLSAIIVLLLVRTNRFNKEYESILQNVLNLNTIKGVGAKAAADILHHGNQRRRIGYACGHRRYVFISG